MAERSCFFDVFIQVISKINGPVMKRSLPSDGSVKRDLQRILVSRESAVN